LTAPSARLSGEVKTAPSEIIAGLIHGDKPRRPPEKFKNYNQLMKWCSQFHAAVRGARTPTRRAGSNAMAFGAVGIGLTRTEHMFFEGNRIEHARDDSRGHARRARRGAAKLLRISATTSSASSRR